MGPYLLLAATLAVAAPAPPVLPDTGGAEREAVGFAAPPAALVAADPDFLFGRPRGSLGFRVGYAVARAGSDLFEESRERFTLGSRDFDAVTLGLDVGVWGEEWYDALLSLTWSRSSAASEYRDWVDEDDLPIEQETSLSQLAATLGMKLYPTERGRAIGSLAWVPARVTPYVGVAGGLMRYAYTQRGDFVDFDDLGIYTDELATGGWTPVGHLLGGVDVGVGARAVLRMEGRLAVAAGRVAQDYKGYDDLDLSGFQATAGLAVRF